MRHDRLAFALAVLLLSLGAPAARADERIDPWAWGLAGFEVSGMAYALVRFDTHVLPDDSSVGATAANIAPMFIGAGVGLAANHWDLDARPALAAHGAVWGSLDLFLLGAAIDGRHESSGLRVGTTAWTLGAVGALAGGALGATAGNRERQAWLSAPAVGFGAGLLVGGLVAISGADDDHAARNITLGIVGGMTTTIALASAFGFLHHDPSPGAAALVPQVAPHTVMLSYGGAF